MNTLNLLFVCGKNQWRSPTGEAIYRDDQRFEARSAGLSKTAKRRLTLKNLQWAHLVFVMEEEQKGKIAKLYGKENHLPEIVCLDIPDIYPFMDEELIELIKQGVETELLDWQLGESR